MLITLKTNHEHAGKPMAAGTEIDLPIADARYLISIDAATPSKPSPIEGEGASKTRSKPKSQETKS